MCSDRSVLYFSVYYVFWQVRTVFLCLQCVLTGPHCISLFTMCSERSALYFFVYSVLWQVRTVFLCILCVPTGLHWVTVLLSLVGKVGSSAAFATIFLYSAEFFPTIIRNSALGMANFSARVGGMLAPYIVDLVRQFYPIVLCIFSTFILFREDHQEFSIIIIN